MTLRNNIIALCLTATAAAGAQNLNKEITIEKEIVPEQRAATRLNVAHITIKPDVRRTDLKFSYRDLPVALVPGLTLLDPAATAPAITLSPYRGYVAAGYFPAFNASVSAGYNLIADSTTVLNAWVQYDGFSYTGDDFSGNDSRVIDNTADAGLSLTHFFSNWQRLAVDATFGYSAMKHPDLYLKSHRNTRFGLDGKWISGDEKSGYHIDLKLGYFGNSFKNQEEQDLPDAVKEMNFGLGFGINYGGFRADLSGSFLNYNSFNLVEGNVSNSLPFINSGNGKTNGVITLRPGYLFENDAFRADLGVKVQYTVNSGKNFHVAPDVRLALVPSSKFSAYANFGGGEHQNTLLSLFEVSHFMQPFAAHNNSHIPFTADLGFVIGPFSGASFELFGGYAKANDWLMPVYTRQTCFFVPVDMKGWHAGARVRYDYRDIASLNVSLEVAPQDKNEGYYLWRDRAKQVLDIDLTVRPMERLTINAGWELRGDRQMSSWNMSESSLNRYETIDLDAVSNLKAGASYRITDAFTALVRGENLLNKKWQDVTMTPMQGITGLIGVEYKF